jgi:hypothetical protein
MRLPPRLASPARLAAVACLAGLAIAAAPRRARAQRPLLGMVPTTSMSESQLQQLRWVEGTWRGDPVGFAEQPFFERYTFLDDSLIKVTFYADSALTRVTGSGRIYHDGGRIFMESGSSRWVAVRMEPGEVLFVPDQHAPNRVRWQRQSADRWLATMRSSMSGTERVRMYQMHRIP